ncbi:MAG: right-handed parallel beta-helix repeat-containing protein [Candidatus Eisenbacteria bacterium]
MKRMLLALGLVVLVTGQARARTWAIRSDGSGDAPTVRAGLDSARAGDTVLVYPGEYEVAGGPVRDYVNLVSYGGRDVTTLYNSTEPDTPIIYPGCDGVLIKGFCFRRVRQYLVQGIFAGGCDRPPLQRNEFVENSFIDLAATDWGGGICLYEGGSALIANNIFVRCAGYDAGGAICCSDQASALIRGNEFYDCQSQFGGAISGSGGGSVEITDNLFVGNYSWKQGGAIWCNYGEVPLIERNTFKDNSASSGGGGMFFQRCTSQVRYNILDGNEAEYGGGLVAGLESHAICEMNTFYGNRATAGGSGIFGAGGTILEVRNCVLAA